MGIVVFLVVGLILLGWATPSEAAAFGAVGGPDPARRLPLPDLAGAGALGRAARSGSR